MSHGNISISSGIKHMPVFDGDRDTGRSVDFNPADQGFAELLYGLKIGRAHV